MKKLMLSALWFSALPVLVFCLLPGVHASRWPPTTPAAMTTATTAMVADVPFSGQLTTQHDTWNRMTTINVFSGQQVFFEVTHISVSTNGQYTINVAANGFTPTINVYGGTFFPATPQVNFWDNGVIGNSLTVFLAGGQQFDIVISTTTAGQTGSYSATISGTSGITVTPPPPLGILSNPLDATIRPGQTTTLQIATQGRPPKTFQWFQGQTGDTSNPIAGATTSSFTTPALFADTAYWVRVSDSTISLDSGTATVFVTNGPITYSSALSPCDDRFNRLIPRTSPGDPIRQSGQIVSYKIFRFRVSTLGNYSFQLNTSGFQGVLFLYQGVFIPTNPSVNFFGNSATGTSVSLTTNLIADGNVMHLVVAQLTPSDTGTFTVTANGPAFVTKLPAPVITTPPASADTSRGQTASFNVGTSSANVSVQWFKGCANRTLIPNETKLNYTTPPQTRDDVYTVRLENPGGYETSTANVTILPFAGDVNADAIVQNTSLSVIAPGLLRSATAGDGRTLTAQKVSNPAHGTVNITTSGGFTYTPAANYSGPDSFTYRVSDGVRFSNTATVFLTVVPVFANNTPTSIPSSGQASNYPSTINVSGLVGTITKVRVKLDRLRHESQGDLDILLQGPQGQALVLMSDANGDTDNPFLFDRVLTFEDSATQTIPDGQALFDGTYRPVNYGGGDSFPTPAPASFNSPAPAGTATFASTFNGTDPNGAWKLFIFDDQGFNSGSLPGWSLTIFTNGVGCPRFTITPAGLPDAVINTPFPATTLAASGGAGLYTFQITAGALPNGMDFTSAGVLSGTPTQAGPFPFTVTATDQNNCTWLKSYTLNVNCPAITVQIRTH
ncbi:MAG TPA: Ig-like domain-containing protein [Blastocatellia bacterium]|nr:Ig-like domain-containing protein [Blastocatellia bacterium]